MKQKIQQIIKSAVPILTAPILVVPLIVWSGDIFNWKGMNWFEWVYVLLIHAVMGVASGLLVKIMFVKFFGELHETE